MSDATNDPTRLLSAALRAAANGIVITDRLGIIQWVNPAFSAMTGYAADEAVGRSPRDLVRSGRHDADFYRDFWATILRGDVWRGRMVNRRKDGSLYDEEQTVTPVRDDAGEITHFIAVKEDVTKTERALERLRFQAQLLDAAGEAIMATDLDGEIRYWSRGAEALYGWTRDEVVGRNVLDVTPSDASARQAAEIMERLRKGERWSGEFEVRRRDGTVFTAYVTDSPLRDEAGNLVGMVGISHDLTRHRSLEQQLRQAQKMEAIGRLAGGIAHDLNNVLTAILGHAQLALDHVGPGPVHEDVEQIRRDAERAGRLVQQILAFSRRQIIRPAVLDLGALVRGLERMLRPLIRENVTFTVEADCDGRIEADPGQIEQVVLNLAINAADAMAGGGSLTIAVERREGGEGEADDALPAGPYLVLSVSDTGHGMSPATIERIFEPFFTTKPPGVGTGLGLATAWGIVQQAGGRIEVESEPGSGSTFRVWLPATAAPLPPAPRAVRGGGERGKGATVLLVEDEPSVRALARRVLERAEFRVMEASGADQALEALAALDGQPLDLLVTDVIMPGLSGVGLATRVLAARPGTRVVFMSGYAETEVLAPQRLPAGHGFIAKPFTPGQLVAAATAALGDD